MKIVNHHVGCCGFTPVRPDGSQWGHVLGLPGGASVHADSPREILEELIEGYAALPDEAARRAARERHAVEIGARHQELRIEQAVAAGAVDLADPDDAAFVALLRDIRCRPIALSDPAEPDAPPVWEGAVRIVALTTAYAPYGELPPPGGLVDWIDPGDEAGYLISLRRCGALDSWAEAVHA